MESIDNHIIQLVHWHLTETGCCLVSVFLHLGVCPLTHKQEDIYSSSSIGFHKKIMIIYYLQCFLFIYLFKILYIHSSINKYNFFSKKIFYMRTMHF